MNLIQLNRPAIDGERRLFYRTEFETDGHVINGRYEGDIFIKAKNPNGCINLDNPANARAQIRLYRWFYHWNKNSDEPSGMILKDELMRTLFEDFPMSKIRVGRILHLVVLYDLSFQQNRRESNGFKNLQFWRWSHALEICYGLEHLMRVWLPRVINYDGGECRTTDDLKEEFEILRSDDNADADIAAAMTRRLFGD